MRSGRGTHVFKSQHSYPADWKARADAVKVRDGNRCTQCGRDRVALAKLSRVLGVTLNLEAHHTMSARKGNHSKRVLRTVCSLCHARQPGHAHLLKRLRRP